MLSTPTAAAIGTLASRTARPRSLAIITRRRLPQRSASAPACSASTRFGAHTSAVSTPICAGVACRVSTPTRGSAMPFTWSPSIEMLCADQ